MERIARATIVVGTAAMLALVFVVDPTGSATDFGLFFGRFHPTIVHFPVALLVVAACVELLLLRANTEGGLARSAKPLLLLAAWSSIVAVVAGLFLQQGGGYELETIGWHRRAGVITALAAAGAYLWRSRGSGERVGSAYVAAIIVVLAGVVFTGHLGGTLTHGEGYLTRYAPDVVRSALGLPAKSELGVRTVDDPTSATVFDVLVQPVLTDKCVACHNTRIRRGALALHSAAALIEGGEDGPVLVAGDPASSEIVRRISLPDSDSEHMPPAHRPQVTVAEFELLRWWIEDGASFDKKLTAGGAPPAVALVLDSWGLSDLPRGVFALPVVAPSDDALEAVRESGIRVDFVAGDSPFLRAGCANPEACLNEAQLDALAAVSDQLVWLDLGSTSIGDGEVAGLARLPHISRLHLQKTGVTDASAELLRGFQHLEYLNLYGTRVTDVTLDALDSLRSLQSVFLWQTGVSADRVDRFREEHPGVYVNTGADTTDAVR